MASDACPNCFRTDYWDPVREECRFCGWSPDVALDEDGDWFDGHGFEDEPEGSPGWG